MLIRCRVLLPLLPFLLLASPAAAQVANVFDAGTEGWFVVSYPFRSHVANPSTSVASFDGGFGNPAGSLRVGDVFGETGVGAPATYLGDKSAYYGGTLAYDILVRFTDAVDYPAVVLNGGTTSLYYDAPTPAVNQWTSRQIPLTESGWRVAGGTTPATQGQFKSVLANLQGLYVYTEWHSGPDDTSFDNVSLAAPAPTPSIGLVGRAMLLLLMVFAAGRRLTTGRGAIGVA